MAATFYTEDADLWMVQGSRGNNSGYQKLYRIQEQLITTSLLPTSIKFGIVIPDQIPHDEEPDYQTSYNVMRFERRRKEEKKDVEYQVKWRPEERELKDKVEVWRKENGEEEKLLGKLMSYKLENTRGENIKYKMKKMFDWISEHMVP